MGDEAIFSLSTPPPVKVPDALALQLLAPEWQRGAEVAQQPSDAAGGDLPNAEESKDVVDAVRMEIPAGEGGREGWGQEGCEQQSMPAEGARCEEVEGGQRAALCATKTLHSRRTKWCRQQSSYVKPSCECNPANDVARAKAALRCTHCAMTPSLLLHHRNPSLAISSQL